MAKKVIRVKNEDKLMSFEDVLEEFTPLLHQYINRYLSARDTKLEVDDLFQELSLATWEAYKDYDWSKGNHFSTLLHFKCLKYLSMNTKKMQSFSWSGEHFLNIEDFATTEDGDDTTDFLDCLSCEEQSYLWLEIKDCLESYNLTDSEMKTLAHVLNRDVKPLEVVAQEENVTKSAIFLRWSKLREKLAPLREEILA